jgi:hypothetical protein
MAVFIEKPPVTSSNCYETMKNASILTSRNFDAKASSRRIENNCIIINIKEYQFN